MQAIWPKHKIINTQGYEKNVLNGANKSLKNIKIIQLEMSLVALYENEMLFPEMIHYLDNKGFQLFSLENGFSDVTTGQLLQIDGVFVPKGYFLLLKITSMAIVYLQSVIKQNSKFF